MQVVVALLLVMTFLLLSGDAVRSQSLSQAWRTLPRVDVTVSTTDATVVVPGWLTTVAALSIALVALNSSQSTSLAAETVWADMTVLAVRIGSCLALGVATTPLLHPGDERQGGLAALLLSFGGLASLLSVSVTAWTGREALRRRDAQRSLEHVARVRAGFRPARRQDTRSSRERFFALWRDRSPRARCVARRLATDGLALLRLILIVTVSCVLLTMCLHQALRLSGLDGAKSILRLVRLSAVLSVILTIGTLCLWRGWWQASLDVKRSDRWPTRFLVGAFVVLLAVLSISFWFTASGVGVKVLETVTVLSPVCLTGALLRRARRRPRSACAGFAVEGWSRSALALESRLAAEVSGNHVDELARGADGQQTGAGARDGGGDTLSTRSLGARPAGLTGALLLLAGWALLRRRPRLQHAR